MEKRKYQDKAIDKAKKHFAKHSRGKIIWACGLGKSLAGVRIARAVRIAKAMKVKKVLVCVPNLNLVQQILKDWANELAGKDVEWLCVCCDGNVSKGDDEWEVDPSELDIAVTTDAGDVRDFLRKRTSAMKVVFTTYQSGDVLAEGAKGSQFDFGVFDEAHRTAGTEGLFSHLLYDDNVKIRKRLFMTATERYYRGEKADIVSMCNKKVYGETIDFVSFRRGIDMGYLCDYRLVVMTVKQSEIAEVVRNNPVVTRDGGKPAEAQMIAAALVSRKAMDKFGLKKAITFHGTIPRAQEFADIQRELNDRKIFRPVDVLHVNGKEPSRIRRDKMNRFKNPKKRSLITNAKCLTEGMDFKPTDMVVFADPKSSLIDIVQAIGRLIRQSKDTGKTMGYVVIPVVIDDTAEDTQSQAGKFAYAIEIIRAMLSMDEKLVAQVHAMAKGNEPEGDGSDQILQFVDALSGEHADLKQWSKALRPKMLNCVRSVVPFMSHAEWRKEVRRLGITSGIQYYRMYRAGKLPQGMAAAPQQLYQASWTSWPEELGVQVDSIMPRDEWRKTVRKLGIDSKPKYDAMRMEGKLPPGMPAAPCKVYKKEWQGWPAELGKTVASLVTHEAFRKIVRQLKIGSVKQYKTMRAAGNMPPGVPSHPDSVYKDWQGWPSELGTVKAFVSHKEWRKTVRRLGINSQQQYRAMRANGKLPVGMPSAPNGFYLATWTNWREELTGKKVAPMMSHEQWRKEVRRRMIRSSTQYHHMRSAGELPPGMPSEPNNTYSATWQGWPAELGKQQLAAA